MPVDITSLLLGLGVQLGAGGILGFLAGYALKKIAKIVAVVLGLFILALMYLNYIGVIVVRWEGLLGITQDILRAVGTKYGSFAVFILQNIPSAASFTVGFALGIKTG